MTICKANYERDKYSFGFINTAILVANSAVMLIDPVNNRQGIVIFNVNLIVSGAATNGSFALIASNNTPAQINDGTPVCAGIIFASVTSIVNFERNIFIPPNKGLFLYPNANSAATVLQGLYIIL